MYLSLIDRLCNAQAVTADAATADTKNLGASGQAYENLFHFVQINVDFATCDSVTFKLQTATDEAFTAPVDLAVKTVLVADLLANKIVWGDRIPAGCLQYVRGYFQVDGADATAGKATWHFGVKDMRISESGGVGKVS